SAISFAAVMLFFWASRPFVWDAPSFKISTGIPPAEACCIDIFHIPPKIGKIISPLADILALRRYSDHMAS
ncbi:MAG TPA: hypothetical protein VFT58_00440, partial [Nitrososphaera sp.]|nr:hypothetical protein [Nitrososphaera sp.]